MKKGDDVKTDATVEGVVTVDFIGLMLSGVLFVGSIIGMTCFGCGGVMLVFTHPCETS